MDPYKNGIGKFNPWKGAPPYPIKETTFKNRPDLADGIVILIKTASLWLTSVLLIGGLSLLGIIYLDENRTHDILITLLIQAAIFLGGPIYFGVIKLKLPLEDLGFRRPALKFLLLATLLAIVFAPLASVLSDALDPELSQIIVKSFVPEEPNLAHMVAMYLVAGLITPLAEEVLFRGVLMGWLKNILGLWPGVILSSALFGLIHIEPTWALIAGLLGLVLAWLYHWSGSIWTSISFHAVYNCTGLTMMYASVS